MFLFGDGREIRDISLAVDKPGPFAVIFAKTRSPGSESGTKISQERFSSRIPIPTLPEAVRHRGMGYLNLSRQEYQPQPLIE